MLKIKLLRVGKKKQPAFRIVVAEARSKLNGRYLEQIGFYDPKQKPFLLKIDKSRYENWLKKGAKPTRTLTLLLKRNP